MGLLTMIALLYILIIGNVQADIRSDPPQCGRCLCADVRSVLNVRDGPYGKRIGAIRDGECYKSTGKKVFNRGFQWFSIDLQGNPNSWVAGRYLTYGSGCSSSTSSQIQALSGTCVCVTATTLNARSEGSITGDILARLSNGQCYKTTGEKQVQGGFNWLQLNISPLNPICAWAAAEYLQISCDSRCATDTSTCRSISTNGCSMVTRAQWGARSPRSTSQIRKPVPHVFIHHTAGSTCSTKSSCSRVVRITQNYHMNTRGWSDIGYNFLIGGDGQVYEGRGWDRMGAHTPRYNSLGYGIAFMGDFSTAQPSSGMLSAAQNLIQCGVQMGKLSSSYSLSGHRDTKCTACPGDRLYDIIQNWPRWHTTPVTKRC